MVNSAYLKAREHERNNHTQLEFEMNMEENLRLLTQELYRHEWKPLPPVRFIIDEPTIREVFAPRFRDRIVSHVLFDIISPLFERTFIFDSYSCRKGKGTLEGVERFEHNIRSVTDNYRYEAFILNLDISGYFMHINKGILYRIICETFEKFKNRDAYPGIKWSDLIDFEFAEYLVRTLLFRNPLEGCTKVGTPKDLEEKLPHSKSLMYSPLGTGLIIGDVMSQIFSNIYLNPFDNFMKRELLAHWYNRYVDDGRDMDRSKEALEEDVPIIRDYLKTNLALDLHPHKTTITSTHESNIFLGACVKPYRRYACNRTMGAFRNAVTQLEFWLMGPNPIAFEDYGKALARINSYLGYLQHFDEYKFIDRALCDSSLNNLFIFTPNYSKAAFQPEVKHALKQYSHDNFVHAWN